MSESNKTRDAWPHPSNFLLGSAESRAAARAMIEARDREFERNQFTIINDIPGPYCEKKPEIGPWMPQPDGSLFRIVRIPFAVDEEALRRILARN